MLFVYNIICAHNAVGPSLRSAQKKRERERARIPLDSVRGARSTAQREPLSLSLSLALFSSSDSNQKTGEAFVGITELSIYLKQNIDPITREQYAFSALLQGPSMLNQPILILALPHTTSTYIYLTHSRTHTLARTLKTHIEAFKDI